MATSFVALGLLAGAAVLLAAYLWHEQDAADIPHSHDDLPCDHPHLQQTHSTGDGGARHAHVYVIDDDHPRWLSLRCAAARSNI